ncbi:hypothetical protein [Bythopirellula goksoeyrii]|uniref:DUF8091 domain-containing protein n=1 Tax=Bythopirellula goksoeyrii TaxID=1400387 RepID=A0A5B9QEN0_9BACT|nr:hypothetical protein [Bythopirellula goksoeyrii]QEG37468.1 hypothetical protein Pr1d_48140 [Bythopirellula goksoeyrii]
METSLHRQLKEYYAGDTSLQEVACAGYRIDAICRGRLIEIQHGSLAAIRDKIAALLVEHRVTVVKPIIATKKLVSLAKKNGPEVSRRLSPKRGKLLDLFEELVYFTRVFPHKRLTLEVALVEIEEYRYPGHGRRRRRREKDFQIADQLLVGIVETRKFRSLADLRRMLPRSLPTTFHTGHLAKEMQISRADAQRIAYCLRETGGIRMVGKEGNAILYRHARRAA